MMALITSCTLFFIERIQDMEAQVKRIKSIKKSVLGRTVFPTAFCRCLEGFSMLPGKRKKTMGFVLSLHMMTVWENVISCILKICRQIQITW